jgi:hypothetical protein
MKKVYKVGVEHLVEYLKTDYFYVEADNEDDAEEKGIAKAETKGCAIWPEVVSVSEVEDLWGFDSWTIPFEF